MRTSYLLPHGGRIEEGGSAALSGTPPVEDAVSSGGVVYRHDDGGVLFALCGRTQAGTWSLPKGTPDDGETIEQTALREVREETGLEVEIEAPLGEIEYWFTLSARRVHKRVHFYLMSERGGSVADHDAEFDVVEWFPALQAVDALTFPTEAEIARRALSTLSAAAAEEPTAARGEGDRG